jgi:hypothetical protein
MAAGGFGRWPTEGRREPFILGTIIMAWNANVASKLRPTSSPLLRPEMLRRRHHHLPQRQQPNLHRSGPLNHSTKPPQLCWFWRETRRPDWISESLGGFERSGHRGDRRPTGLAGLLSLAPIETTAARW